MKSVRIAVLLAAVAVSPAMAQEKAAPSAASLPAGWNMKLDRDGADPARVAFSVMGDGFHVTTGPAAVFWNNAHLNLDHKFRISATFTQTKAPQHPEAYGIFIGGKNMDKPDAEYGYLIIRGDGKYAIKHRANATEVHTIADWTDLASMKKADEKGVATNTVSFDAGADSVRAYVNGTQVASWARAYWNANGVAGLRVNHQLDVHVSRFEVTPVK